MNFYTLFTRTKNIHLIKDVGMLPESLVARHDDVRTYLVTYNNEGEQHPTDRNGYSHYGKEITHTHLIFLKKKFGKYIDGISFIKSHASDIDVLNIYHLNLSSYLYCLAAKRYLKKEALIYLKLDAGFEEVKKLLKKSPVAWIKRRTIALSDIVTVETKRVAEILQEQMNLGVEYLPNGIYVYPESLKIKECDLPSTVSLRNEKRNIILTVGHLGTPPKNTSFLIDAFVKSADKHDYELRLIGAYTDEIRDKIDALKAKKPYLSDRIKLIGEITDREVLDAEYRQAKIFAFPSRWESFGFVLLEALNAGCYIIASEEVPLAYDIIEGDSHGMILPIAAYDNEFADQSTAQIPKATAEESTKASDERYAECCFENFNAPNYGATITAWADAFVEISRNEPDWDRLLADGRAKVGENYSWSAVADRLYSML